MEHRNFVGVSRNEAAPRTAYDRRPREPFVRTTQIDNQRAVDEDPYVVITIEIESSLGAVVMEEVTNLGRHIEVAQETSYLAARAT